MLDQGHDWNQNFCHNPLVKAVAAPTQIERDGEINLILKFFSILKTDIDCNTCNKESILQIFSLKGVSLFEEISMSHFERWNATACAPKSKNEIELKNEMVMPGDAGKEIKGEGS